MKVPEPKIALENICSVIHDNVLYTYSAGAFQSLVLEEGAEWKTLAQGEPVTGAVCVGSNPKDPSQAGLYIVGGKAASADYRGLQKFTYSTGKWESISPQDPVTQNRLLHGATYLAGTDQIVMYGGSQDGYSGPSTQTFVVGASAPYNTRAFSSTAAPVINPMLLPWSDTQAALVGGSATNDKIMLFSPDKVWTDSGATLAEPLTKDTTAMKAVIINGDDGSKSLYTFDLSMTPNQVKRMVLIDASGAPVVNSAAVSKNAAREATSEFVKRALTLSDWPAYNSTWAPTGTRLNSAIAQGPDGLVVFAGGSGSANDSLCIFNARENTWENAAQKLSEQDVLISSDSTSSTSGTAATPTASDSSLLGPSFSTLPASVSASASSSPAASSETAAAGAPAAVGANAILGIVLGTITGIMILLGLILFCIRRRRAKNHRNVEGGHDARGMSPRGFADEKAGLGYGTDDFDPNPGGRFRGHQQQESAGSFSSMAILMGKVNGNKPPKYGDPRDDSNSFFKSTIGKPIPQVNDESALSPPSRDEKAVSFAADVVEPRPGTRGAPVGRNGETRRSSGWNRYWSGGSALNILGFGNSKRTTVDSDRSSRYSSGIDKNRITQDSATVPPLHLTTQDLSTIPPIQHDGRPELSRVVSGSPTVSNYSNQIPFRDGVSAKIESPHRPQSDASSGYSSGIPESVRDTWDPTGPSRPWGADRAPSSVYAESLYPTSLAPSMPTRPPQMDRQIGVSQQPPLAMASTSSDMSWLNLGDINKQNQR
ncbi:pre-mRNA splicing factor CLF1 [Colletotrichum sublineola]|uniref:Putative pre-mRNA splicing factor CLF1 n=1 Tax=Colletotrichum sublineola TaxID=1173701 RepID=A0A066WZR1_COLSU|nr:pre-mRNA splicing factor CLF1 [Colletotrichum sublineola]KDN62393.1 putative pre-mRNA splicing factor CLF1 [Colletotrichum sublineola]